MTMSEETRGDLTLSERRFLETLQEAANEGVSLRDYYRAHGLSVTMLYKVRRRLVQKGLLPPLRQSAGTTEVPGKLVEVRVAEATEEAEVAVPVYLHREPIDLRKYAPTIVMRTAGGARVFDQQKLHSTLRITGSAFGGSQHGKQPVWCLEPAATEGRRQDGSQCFELLGGIGAKIDLRAL
jgi:transposase-like protein